MGQTGEAMQDRDHRNVIATRVRSLLDTPFELITRASAARQAAGPDPVPAGRKPEGADGIQPPTLRPGECLGSDPYSCGPARAPEKISFNPHDRSATRRR